MRRPFVVRCRRFMYLCVSMARVYGGPNFQRVRDTYRTTMNPRPQRFRNLGYVVVQVDNRGTSRRGVQFMAPLKHKFGTVEVEDQVSWLIG